MIGCEIAPIPENADDENKDLHFQFGHSKVIHRTDDGDNADDGKKRGANEQNGVNVQNGFLDHSSYFIPIDRHGFSFPRGRIISICIIP